MTDACSPHHDDDCPDRCPDCGRCPLHAIVAGGLIGTLDPRDGLYYLRPLGFRADRQL